MPGPHTCEDPPLQSTWALRALLELPKRPLVSSLRIAGRARSWKCRPELCRSRRAKSTAKMRVAVSTSCSFRMPRATLGSGILVPVCQMKKQKTLGNHWATRAVTSILQFWISHLTTHTALCFINKQLANLRIFPKKHLPITLGWLINPWIIWNYNIRSSQEQRHERNQYKICKNSYFFYKKAPITPDQFFFIYQHQIGITELWAWWITWWFLSFPP